MEQSILLRINSKLPYYYDYLTKIINNSGIFLVFLLGRFISIRNLVTWLKKKININRSIVNIYFIRYN